MEEKKKIGFFFGLGIFLFPLIFSWFTLRKGYSNFSRIVCFLWLAIVTLMAVGDVKNAKYEGAQQTSQLSSKTDSQKPLSKPKKKITYIEDTCSDVSVAFSSQSPFSDVQKKEKWKRYNNRNFKWVMKVSEVSEATFGSGYVVSLLCENTHSLLADVRLRLPSSYKNAVLDLKKGSYYEFKGVLEDYGSLIGLSATAISD